MSHQSDLISSDINAYLAQHERKELLRFLTCGNVDDGKSTLIGRLLHDSKMIYEDQLAAVQADSVKSGTTGAGKIDLALLVDGLQAEREQGITIDVAYRYFSTATRKFIIADTPGHEQYTRNMATGASTCDLAIILIDARYGLQTQTKRHSFIASLLGIRHIIVAINKMDLVGYSQATFSKIKADYLTFVQSLELDDIRFIPLSALDGDNVVNASENMPWFTEQPLMEALNTIEIANDRNFEDARLPVQYVNRPHLNFRGFCGTIATGRFAKGDQITVLPSGKTSTVKRIVTYDGELEHAFAPMAVTLTLDDEIDISRGDMIVGHQKTAACVADRFKAHIVWMTDTALTIGKQYIVKLATRSISGSVSLIHHRIDVNTLEHHDTNLLQLNEIGLCSINVTAPVVFDNYKTHKGTGAFILIDRLTNATVAAGMIIGSDNEENLKNVSVTERAARFGQIAVTLNLIGPQALAIAYQLERRLFDNGHACTVLEGNDKAPSAALVQIINEAGLIAICVNAYQGGLAIQFDTNIYSLDDIYVALKTQQVIY